MRRFRGGCVIGSMLLAGCGGGLGSVQGHEVSDSQAIYLSTGTPSNLVLLVVGGMSNLCDVFTGKARPSGSYTMLETLLANWNGSSTDPLVPGTYVQTAAPSAAGLVSETLVQYGSGCVAYGSPQAGSGNISVDSFGGFQSGAHLVVEVDLKFGDDHLSGKVDAVYCGVSQHICGP